MKLKFIFPLSVCFLFLIYGQESPAQKKQNKNSVEVEKIYPKFSYSPLARENVGSTGLTIALLNPVFLDKDIKRLGSPFSDFAKAMASDLDEVLISKGFRVIGPFSSFDEMVVSDKNNSDFILEISIDIEPSTIRRWQTIMQLLSSANLYKVSQGDVSFNGKVSLIAHSCFSKEKLWIKNLDLNQKKFSYSGSVKWPTSNVNQFEELNQDVNLWNPFCKILEEYYKESFDIFYKQFEKAEMANIAKDSRKIDKERRGN